MRSTTALKVLAGVGLVMFVFAIATSIQGGGEDARTLFLAALTIGGILALIRFRKRPRREAMVLEARRLGFEHAATDPFGLLDLPFALFRRTRAAYGELDNVMWGRWRDFEVRAFDYAYARSGDEEPRRLSCAMAVIPNGWPTLVIQPETLITTVADHLALSDIAFESETFNRAFDVRSEDRRFANALVDARLMEWLLEFDPRPGFEIDGSWVLAYRPQVQPWEIESVLRLMDGFIERIPRAVRSTYPPTVPPRPDAPA